MLSCNHICCQRPVFPFLLSGPSIQYEMYIYSADLVYMYSVWKFKLPILIDTYTIQSLVSINSHWTEVVSSPGSLHLALQAQCLWQAYLARFLFSVPDKSHPVRRPGVNWLMHIYDTDTLYWSIIWWIRREIRWMRIILFIWVLKLMYHV